MAARLHSVVETVRAKNEYLQVQTYSQNPRALVARVYDGNEDREEKITVLVA